MTWNPLTQPVDYIELAGERSPGLADVVGIRAPIQWDDRRGYGLSGATTVYRGFGLATWSVRIRLYSESDWEAWESFSRLLARPAAGERAQALDIVHPLLDALGIASCVIVDPGAPEQSDDGVWTVDVKMKEFRRPTVAVQPVDGAKDRVAGETDPFEAQISALTHDLAALNARATP